MAYFNRFPLTPYFSNNNIDYSIVTDITRRLAVRDEIKQLYTLYDEYDVSDDETPEIVSFNLYGTTDYHWIILLLNDIIDPRYEWVLSESNLRKYVEAKYGSDDANVFATHHYKISNDDDTIVDPTQATYANAIEVTNMDYEIEQNEKKRRIKVLRKEYLPSFIAEFEKKING